MNKTQEEKIAEIRKACVAANGDIMKLQFGCEVEIKEGVEVPSWPGATQKATLIAPFKAKIICNYYYGDLEYLFAAKDECSFDLNQVKYAVLGRPIRLADVVLALEFKLMGKFKTVSFAQAQPILETCMMWLKGKDNLRDQSPECIDFLYSLLKA